MASYGMKEGKAADTTYIVEVAPLSKNAGSNTLTYFSTEKIISGTLVKAPLRNSIVPGVVTGSKSTSSAKADIRKANFILKKIPQRNISEAVIAPAFLQAAKDTAHYYASPLGSVLSAMAPKLLLEKPELFFKTDYKDPRYKKRIPKETFLIQMETEERYGQYRALIRQCFARQASVLFIAPTNLDALRAASLLSQGIAEYVYIFTLKEKSSEAKKIWANALASAHPILFIATPAGIAFDRPDLDTVIMERENSRAYRTQNRPYIHIKTFLEFLCKHYIRQLVLGDSVLSIETLYKEKKGEYGELSLIRWRLPAAPSALVDASAKPDQDGKFSVISSELKSLIRKALDEKEKVFLFGVRKGLAPTTVCGDCGFTLPCLNCNAPVVLHRKNSENIYLCHACGTKRDSLTTCGYCGSWKLVPLGIGVERIASEVWRLFPGKSMGILDKEHAPTDAKAKSIAKKFKEEGGVLIGTELALLHLDKVPYVGLVSADALFSIPDFGSNERIFYLVSRLREMTLKESVIQTRNIGKQVLAWASSGNIIDFYSNEIHERRNLLYPPFSIFIKITSLSDKANEDVKMLKEQFLEWHPDIFKDSLILRLPKEEWPNEEIVKRLALLGPRFSIKVEPESIL